jgi:hypothetical protein
MLLLFLSFGALFYISSMQTKFTRVFPTRDCEPMKEAYNYDADLSPEKLERYAYDDYVFVEENWKDKQAS